jgi:hypothetical protein
MIKREEKRLFVSPRDGALAELHRVWDNFLARRGPPPNDNGAAVDPQCNFLISFRVMLRGQDATFAR